MVPNRLVAFLASLVILFVAGSAVRADEFLSWSVGGPGEPLAQWNVPSEACFFVINAGPGTVELVVDGRAVRTAAREGTLGDTLRPHQTIVVQGNGLLIQPASLGEEAKGLLRIQTR